MTVIRPIETDVRGCQVEEMLQKHWGSVQTVKVFREPNKSLGINIVGGKVDLQSSKKSSETLLGIFIKNVVPNSPAGKTGRFKTGDRILEVSGIDLREASHEKAVQAIRNATNPVTFVIQSLIPWKITENETNENQCTSPFPSSVSTKSSTSNIPNQSSIETNGNLSAQESNKIHATKIEHPAIDDGANLNAVVIQVTPVHSPKVLNEDKVASSSVSEKDDKNEISEKPVTTPISDSEEDDDEEEDDVREMEGRTVSAKGYAIDRASAANVKRSKDEIANDNEQEDEFGYTMNTAEQAKVGGSSADNEKYIPNWLRSCPEKLKKNC